MSEVPTSGLMLMTAGLFLAMAAARWHQAGAAAPDRLEGTDRPAAVLLVQPGDCPQRRAAMVRWLAAFRGHEADSDGLPVALATLGDDPGGMDEPLTTLSRLNAADTRRVARAVLRAGVPGTPALALVGADGTVLLVDTFAPDGLGPRLTHALALLPRLAPPMIAESPSNADRR